MRPRAERRSRGSSYASLRAHSLRPAPRRSRSASCCRTSGTYARARHRHRERLQAVRRRSRAASWAAARSNTSKVDDESEPAKATDNVNKLIKRDNVDVLIGTVHSGVALAMAKAAKDSGIAADHAERRRRRGRPARCARRTSSAARSPTGSRPMRWARCWPEGRQEGVTITWKYAAGDESVEGLQGRLREGRRQDREGALRCRSRTSSSRRC